MKYFLALFSIAFIAFSCTNDTVNGVYGEAEKAYEADPSAQNLKKLSTAYSEYLTAFPDSEDRNDILMKNAALQIKSNRFPAAIEAYKTVIKNDLKSPQATEAAFGLSDIYGSKLNNPLGQDAVNQGIKAAYPDNPKSANLPTGDLGIDSMLLDLGAKIYNDKTNRIDFKIANDFINIAEIHALFMPENAKTAEYLHDAGRTAGYQRAYNKAIDLYKWVVDKYPNHEQTANSMFMLGYTYDNDLKDYGEARKYYEMFLAKHGNHDLAASAKVLLENLGVPDDEIIERLQKKNG